MKSLVDPELPPKLLIYGPAGCGKTVFSATALDVPDLRPVLMLDVEGQVRSIKSRQRLITLDELGNPEEGLIDRIRMKKWDDVCRTYEYLFDRKEKDIRSSYRTLIIDSGTDINDKAIENATGGPFKSLKSVKPPQRQHYGEGHWILKQMLNGFRDMEGLTVIMTALPKDQEAVDSEIQMLKPNFTGQMSELACAKAEFVGYLHADNQGTRWLQFKQKGRIYAKWRDEGKEPAEIKEPTMLKFLQLLQENN